MVQIWAAPRRPATGKGQLVDSSTGKWLRRLIVALAAIAALYFIGATIGATLLLNHLTVPGTVDWSGANNPNPPSEPTELGYRGDPAAAFALSFETVHYPTDLGPAEAWLVPGTRADAPWAIYVHGIGGIRENGNKQLTAIKQAGLTTLLIEYRNDRDAPADPRPLYAFGTTEWPDLNAAVSYALANGATSVVIVADSMGGAITGQFLRHSAQADRVTAIALDAPALDLDQVVAATLEQLHLPFARELAIASLALFDFTRGSTLSDADTRAELARFPGPLFLSHGSADVLVPVAISDELVPQRQGPTTYLRTGANHLLSYKEDPERYRDEMVAFLESLLGVT
jgi:uncharacterized protein